MHSLQQWYERVETRVASHSHRSGDAIRLGLGAFMTIGGTNKMLSPEIVEAYFAPVFASMWPYDLLPVVPLLVFFGFVELVFGILLIADRYTFVVAGVTVPWLAVPVGNFVVAVLQAQPVADLLSLYLGMLLLAVGVTLSTAPEQSS